MAQENEYGTKSRLLRIMMAILDAPRMYTADRLRAIYTPNSKSSSTIRRAINDINNAGFLIDSDEKDRYFFVESKPFKKLKDLLHFSEEDQQLLYRVIDEIDISQKRGQRLKKKLASLYDYRKLGHAYLRKPYLSKIDVLQNAKDNEYRVVLVDYRSFNRLADRLVEPFHISPSEDILQAYDVEAKSLRHYRISRIRRVRYTDQKWEYKSHHNIIKTDPFRIVDNNQVMVHLRLGLGAYNELTERFPMTKYLLEETENPEIFDFQCMVNHKFKGLTNFILGYYHEKIEILEPDSLLEHLQSMVIEMDF